MKRSFIATASDTTVASPSETTAPPADDPLGDAPDFAACADAFVAATNALDLSGIDGADGLDPAELQLADDRLVALEEEHPVLGEDHPCATVIEGVTPEQANELVSRLDPAIVEILQTPAP